MHFTPLDNLRRCIIASPPWVIFTLSMAVMAFGVFILACRLRNDSYAMQPNLATAHYCVVTDGKIKNSLTTSTTAVNSTNDTMIVAVPVVIWLRADFYHEMVNKSMSDGGGIKWTGTLHDGQLGFKGTDPNATLPFELLLESSVSHHCVDETCDFMLVQACATVRGVTEQHQKAHTALDADVGAPVCNKAKSAVVKSVTSMSVINRLDLEGDSAAMIDDKWCEHGSIVSMQRRDDRGLVLIPLLHDTVTARLHLLYTSYFLFTTILVLIVYATCRKTSHTKHTVRTLESVHSNYSKLSNDRE